jgi:ABC-2 type transport system permease protein
MRRHRVIAAVAARELEGYFSTPTGYVFITLFVFLSAMAAFWQERFFAGNLANLDQLNAFFPYLLIFLVPAISMSLWAEERKQGTEELLLTLPASDFDIVLGKYVAGVLIYSIALLFSLSHVVVLSWLGSPDPGLMASTYFGYWLMGAALLALGMLASLLTDNLTVAFIAGAVFCAVPVFLRHAGAILTGWMQRAAESLSLPEQFRDLSQGVVTPGPLVYFAALAATFLYLNVLVLGKRRWRTGPKAPPMRLHAAVRAASLLVALASITVLAGHARARFDVTAEKIHSLSPETTVLLRNLSARQPVFVQAYFSPDVPRSYTAVRRNLSAMLREFDAVAGEGLHARIIETVKYSPSAREAQERYNIRPQRLPATEETGVANEIFLGLVFTSGSEEFVIPFFDRGLPVEYELMRSIRVVSRARRKKVGILDTPARLFGGFDFQSRSQAQEWSIVPELRKQYEVVRVAADSDYPEDLDALIAALPSALPQARVDRLTAYVRRGKPVLLMLDPMPAFNLDLAPHEIASQGPMFAPPPSSSPKADLRALLEAVGVEWPSNRIAWDNYNPHPQLRSLPKEFVFAGKGFNPREPVSAGLQEVVLLYPGVLRGRGSATFTPLIETSGDSGHVRWEDLVQRSMFGVAINQQVNRRPEKQKQALAARVEGNNIHAIVIADVDLMGEQFFELRRRGVENLNFDNVTFLLNAVDQLAGDPSFIALRKRRPRHRTLEAVEARTSAYEEQRQRETQEAEVMAEQRLKQAQARLDRAVAEVRARADLDDQTRQIMISNLEAVENRRLTVARSNIEDEKQRQIENSRAEMENSVRGIQNTIKLLAVALPPVPAFVLFVLVSIRRLRRERIGVPSDRLVEAQG